MNDSELERNVRRTVGIATLRRLRRMIDADRDAETRQARWAKWLAWGFALAAVATLAWMAFR